MKWSIALLVALALGAASCLQAEVKVKVPPKSDTTVLVKGDSQFAFELYRRLSAKEGNLFLSPYSISTALAMTTAGARGKTLEQMTDTLHLPPQNKLHPAMAWLMHEINHGASKKTYQLSTANALWGAKGYPFRREFLQQVQDNYGANLTDLDFAGDAEGARKTINAWVEKETQDKIKDLIAKGVLDDRTRLVLTNAIYFKGNWVLPFKKDRTRDETFRAADGTKPKAPLMHQTDHFGYAETDDFQALELPYAGKELSMLVLLPKKDDLAGLEKKFDAALVNGVVAKLAHPEVMVSLPKFKTTAQFELADVLSKMGMPLAFRGGDFSGMTTAQESLEISNVIHKAYVDVNEEGTEAAAATAVAVKALSAAPTPTPVFRADHPFVYLIRDRRNGSVLFVGRMADPTK